MSPKTKEKRRQLAAISKGLQHLKKMGAIDSVNQGLLEMYAEQEKCNPADFHTFIGWKELGKFPQKGETAYCIWGKPKKFNVDKTNDAEKTAEEKQFSFYPLCYVFSPNQVN